MNTAALLTKIFDILNKESKYAVLRNYEGLPEKNTSRDIDIAIEKKDFLKTRSRLAKLIEESGWRIVTYLKSDRLITWGCGIVHPDGTVEVVQLDFFYHTSVFGILLLDNEQILADRMFNGKLYHVEKQYEFLDKYLYDRAVGVDYPDKYGETRRAVEKDPLVEIVVKRLFRQEDLIACDRTSKQKLLKAALRWNFKRYGLKCLGHYLSFEYYQIKNYFYSNPGFSIGFTGPDGSGKTTVIETVLSALGEVFRKAHKYYHFRPHLFGNLGDVAHSAGIKKEVDKQYDKPHRGKKTGVISSLCRLMYYSVDYIVGYWAKVKTATRITRIVIFDRYYTDIICDSRRSRIYLNSRFLYGFGKLFVPSLDYNILLTAELNTILARKQELDGKGIEAINSKIDFLKEKKGYYKIMNDGTPQDAVAKILRIVFDEQHKKNMKRMR